MKEDEEDRGLEADRKDEDHQGGVVVGNRAEELDRKTSTYFKKKTALMSPKLLARRMKTEP